MRLPPPMPCAMSGLAVTRGLDPGSWEAAYPSASVRPFSASASARDVDDARKCYQRSTYRIVLDGEGMEVRQSWNHGIFELRAYCFRSGVVVNAPEVVGLNKILYTTAISGQFDMELEYNQRVISFPIDATNLYITGWINGSGKYKLTEESQGQDFKNVGVGVNYHRIFANGLGRAYTGLYALRNAFDTLWDYKGGKPAGLRPAIGTIALHISEPTRLQPVYHYIDQSFVNLAYSRLDKVQPLSEWIRGYGALSAHIMKAVENIMSGTEFKPPEIEGLQIMPLSQLVEEVPVLLLSAHQKDSALFCPENIKVEIRKTKTKGKEQGGGGHGRAPSPPPFSSVNWTQKAKFSSSAHAHAQQSLVGNSCPRNLVANNKIVPLSQQSQATALVRHHAAYKSGISRGFGLSLMTCAPSRDIWWANYGSSQRATWRLNSVLGQNVERCPPSHLKLVAVRATREVIAGGVTFALPTPMGANHLNSVAVRARGVNPGAVTSLLPTPIGGCKGLGRIFFSLSAWGTPMIVLCKRLLGAGNTKEEC